MELTKDSILQLLGSQNKHVIGRALMALNERQTEVEQRRKSTINRNGRGFRPSHAYMGTSMAGFYESRKHLTDKQIRYWTAPTQKVKGNERDHMGRYLKVSRISIYAGQLLKVAQIKQGKKNCPHQYKLEDAANLLKLMDLEAWCKKNISGETFTNPEDPCAGIYFADEGDKVLCGLKWS